MDAPETISTSSSRFFSSIVKIPAPVCSGFGDRDFSLLLPRRHSRVLLLLMQILFVLMLSFSRYSISLTSVLLSTLGLVSVINLIS